MKLNYLHLYIILTYINSTNHLNCFYITYNKYIYENSIQ